MLRTCAILALSLSTLSLQSCLVSANSHKTHKGRFVGDETLARIQPGSTQEYVLALIGEPSTRTTLSDGGAVWKWEFSEKVSRSGHVLFIVSDDSQKETRGAAYVEFGEDGLVTASWRD